jgi:hypothetical protein
MCIGKTAVVKSAAAVLGVDTMEANCAKFVLGSDKQREQVCVCVFVCMCVCVRACMICMHDLCVYLCMYVHMYVHICVYVRVCIYIYT